MPRKTLRVDPDGTRVEDGRVLDHGMKVVHDMELVRGTGVVHGMEVLVHDMKVHCGKEVLRGMKSEILHSKRVPCGMEALHGKEVAHDMGLVCSIYQAHKDLGHGKAPVHGRVLGRGRPLHHSTDQDHRWALDGDKTQSRGIPMDLDSGEDQACENQMEPYGEKVSCELCGVSCASCGVVFQSHILALDTDHQYDHPLWSNHSHHADLVVQGVCRLQKMASQHIQSQCHR